MCNAWYSLLYIFVNIHDFFLTRPGCDILVWAVLLAWGKTNHFCLRLFNLCFMFSFDRDDSVGDYELFLCWKFLRLVCKLELCIACFYRAQLKQKCFFFLFFRESLYYIFCVKILWVKFQAVNNFVCSNFAINTQSESKYIRFSENCKNTHVLFQLCFPAYV
jgi:hypothetical protein